MTKVPSENMKFTNKQLADAHKKSYRNRSRIEGKECGCFYCLRIFPSTIITFWVDDNQTAICPHCRIDSVIQSTRNFPELLKQINQKYFTTKSCVSKNLIDKDEIFKFVVARPWGNDSPYPDDISIYSCHTVVQTGTMKDAKEFLDYVRGMKPKGKWAIYRVLYEKMNL